MTLRTFYLRAEKIDIPTGFNIYPMTTDKGKSIAVVQPTEKEVQQQEQIAPLTHTDQGLRKILGGNTDYWKLDGDYAMRVHKRPRKALFTPHNSGCPIPEGELDDWRLTIINRQGQQQEQLQENPTQLSKQELQRRLEGDNWTGETRFRRKITPTRRATSKITPTRQSSQPQRLMDTPPTRSKIQLRAPQKIWRPKAAPSTNLDTTQPKETIHRPLAAQEDNQDYWERQGEHWIRHHTTLRTTLFTPTDGPGHPPINTLEPHRTTITHNNFGEVSQRKDDWTVMGNAALPFQWKGTTRFTVKKDYEYIQENHDEEQQHEHHEAHRARGLRQPQQPTPQQIAEHNLTHLPYRNWCPICVQGKGRQDNYKKQQSRQPVIQVDFAYIKSQQDPKTTPVLTAVDVTTQLCMAVLVPDKSSMMDYMINNLQAFIFERGRTQGILQSDNEDTLNALLKATAAKVGTMSVRHSPSYSSNSQGSVERLHRTLLGQIRVVKAQVESNYSMTMSTKHCLLPWIVRHAAWTVNRYVIHSDGYTSFERRWGRNYERAICEFGETLLYLPPQHKKLPKADLRMQKCIWLGKVSETGQNYVATESGVQKVRTVRRLQPDFRHDLALLNKVSGTPWAPRRNTFRNTVGYATTTVREKKVHSRFWTTDECDGRHRCRTRNKTTTHYTTSTTSIYIDVKFTTTTG